MGGVGGGPSGEGGTQTSRGLHGRWAAHGGLNADLPNRLCGRAAIVPADLLLVAGLLVTPRILSVHMPMPTCTRTGSKTRGGYTTPAAKKVGPASPTGVGLLLLPPPTPLQSGQYREC